MEFVNLVESLLEEQQRYLTHYFRGVDQGQMEAFVSRCLEMQGLLIFTGVGKSGIVAEKIAMTLVSTGTRALYLPPTNFLHGDIGILSEQDALIFLSRSGETEELLELVPFVRQRKALLLSIVSNPQSRLASQSDAFVDLPVEKELCPFDLAPTTSTMVQMLFGDLLAVALMRLKKFELQAYAQNHPSGSIGKKMFMTVEQVMRKGDQIPICQDEARLMDILVELSNKKCGAMLVENQLGEFAGIFTDGDLRRALQLRGASVLEQKMGSLMTVSPLSTGKEGLAWDALKLMQRDPKKYVMMLPVLEDKKIVGILHMHDLVHAGIV